MRRNWRSIFIFLTICVDAIVIGLAGISAYLIRTLLPNVPYLSVSALLDLGIFLGLTLLFFGMVLGLYRGAYHSSLQQQYYLALKAYIYSALISFSLLYVLQQEGIPRRFILLFYFLLPVFFMIGRAILNRYNLSMQKRGLGLRNALILGYDRKGMEIFDRFVGFPELGYNIKGILLPEHVESPEKTYKGNKELPRLTMAELPIVARREDIDGVFIPSVNLVTNGSVHLVQVCKQHRIKLKVLSPEADYLLRIARIFDIAGITLYSPPRTRVEKVQKIAKRIFDIVGSVLLVLLCSPVFVLAALAIYAESGRPIIFKQLRSSTKGGKNFYFYKFRSMIQQADEQKENLIHLNESNGALFKMKEDPRLTRVGKILRKFSIDELPQLFNVLKGDMSLVGPRPLPDRDLSNVNEGPEFWDAIKDREKVKPGMTGLWQISGRSNLGFREMVLLDLYYVENQSLLFDLEILFATLPAALFGKGAY